MPPEIASPLFVITFGIFLREIYKVGFRDGQKAKEENQ